jgi:hypothetical protein
MLSDQLEVTLAVENARPPFAISGDLLNWLQNDSIGVSDGQRSN